MICATIALFVLMLGCPTKSAAQDNPTAKQILDRVLQTYSNARSFSCDFDYVGQRDLTTTTTNSTVNQPFKILFSRPDRLRLDWPKENSGSLTNSYFTRHDTLYLYWAMTNKYARKESLQECVKLMANGIPEWKSTGKGWSSTVYPSLMLGGEIPSLLLGGGGFFDFASLKEQPDVSIVGVDCFSFAGQDRAKDSVEVAIDKSTYAIVQLRVIRAIKGAAAADAKKELERTDPQRASKIPDIPPGPDFTISHVATFKNFSFGTDIPREAFDYNLPREAKLVDDALQ